MSLPVDDLSGFWRPRGTQSRVTPVLNGRRGGLAHTGNAAWALLGIALLVLLTGWAVGRLMPVLLPMAVAVLLATLLRPIAARLEERGMRPGLAASIAVVIALLALVGLIALILPPFIARLTDLGSSLEEGVQRVAYSLGDSIAGMDRAAVDRQLDQAVERGRERLSGSAMAATTSLAGGLASVVLVLFLSFFLVKDGRRMWRWLLESLPERRRDAVDEVGERMWANLTAYTRGVVFVATVDAVLIGAVLLILGIPLALPLIVLTWLAAFFPIIGAIVAGAAAVLVALVTGGASLRIDEGGHHRRAHFADRFSVRRIASCDRHVSNLTDMPLYNSRHQGALVRKILVERADGNAGPIGYLDRGDLVESVGEQNLNSRLEDGVDRDARTSLLRLLSGVSDSVRMRGICEYSREADLGSFHVHFPRSTSPPPGPSERCCSPKACRAAPRLRQSAAEPPRMNCSVTSRSVIARACNDAAPCVPLQEPISPTASSMPAPGASPRADEPWQRPRRTVRRHRSPLPL